MKPFSLVFTIDDLPLLPNRTLYSHWRVKHAEAKKWKKVIVETCKWLVHTPPVLKKARIVLVRHSCREPDADGLAASFKHVLDGLVLADIIEDDKPSIIGSPEFKWEKAKQKEGKIRVEVYEVI